MSDVTLPVSSSLSASREAGALARLVGWGRPPVPYEPSVSGADLRWPVLSSVNAGVWLCVGAAAANASREGGGHAVETFYLAVALAYLPFALRTLLGVPTRGEHLANVVCLTGVLYLFKLLREPVAFVDHDEFLHWSTTDGILETGRLFGHNPLLPVSPLYPGLELVAASVVSLSGASVFAAGAVLLGVARLCFVATLFLVYERVSDTRTAACGCLIYMGASTFFVFDVQFSYESLAVPFMGCALLLGLTDGRRPPMAGERVLLVVVLAALAVTHHMTAFVTAGMFAAFAALGTLSSRVDRHATGTLVTAAVAFGLPFCWSKLMGDPGKGYLGPVLESGLREAVHVLTLSTGRMPFVSDDGILAPAWQRVVVVAGLAVTCAGLATGFLRVLARSGLPVDLTGLLVRPNVRNTGAAVLALVASVFPFGILFRLTQSGWEIGNRIGPFSFLGVGLVVATGATVYRRGPFGSVALACSGLLLLVGGIISSQGARILVPDRFQVSADSGSVGPMGISVAEWTRDWLGPRRFFASDRINRLLLATYGRQHVATTLQDGVDTGEAVLARTLDSPDVASLGKVGVEYLTLDLRLSQGLPVVGVYFDGGARDRGYVAPPPPSNLMKFDRAPGVGRIFDNGSILVYDIRGLDVGR